MGSFVLTQIQRRTQAIRRRRPNIAARRALWGSAPFTSDPSGGLILSGGPVLILMDPFLPGGIMTQLGPDFVAVDTGSHNHRNRNVR